MSDIQDYLDDIMNAVYGEEVRSSIVGAIQQCYEDGSAGSVDMSARARLDVIEPVVSSTATTANANVLASLQAEKKLAQDGIHDLNLCVETGKYYADTTTVASGVTNQPEDKTASNTFSVLVLNHYSANSLFQMLTDTDKKIWIRLAVNSSGWTFGNWQRIIDDRDKMAIDSAVATKAPIASPAFTGNPTAPTQTAGNNTTSIATTAFVTTAINNFKSAFDTALSSSSTNAVQNKVVNTALALKAPLASPALTGNPTAPTQSAENNSTRLATTAFVKRAVDNVQSGYDSSLSSSSTNAVQNKVVNSALAAKAPLASPAFTGSPTAPTVSGSTNSSDRIATTAFVQAVKNAFQATLNYSNGDSITFSNYASFSGYIGSSKKFVGFLVPVPKSLANVSGIEVNTIKGAVFGVSGAVSGSTYSTDWTTHTQDGGVIMSGGATAQKVSSNLIQVSMNMGAALSNSTNLSPVTFVATSLKFTFYVN